jgi:hypothetical protein
MPPLQRYAQEQKAPWILLATSEQVAFEVCKEKSNNQRKIQ